MIANYRFMLSTALLLFAHVALTAPARAHVGLERGESSNGTPYKAVLKVPHGCDGSPTHTVRVDVPEGFIGVKPMPKPGWKLETVQGPYAKTYAFYHGKSLAEGVKQIEWSGGDLPDAHYDEFIASGFLAKELEPGAKLYFKVVQVCEKGELRWEEIPAAGQNLHDLKFAAVLLRIAGDPNEVAGGGSVTVGSLVIESAWTRATAHGAKVAAGYLKIRNTGSTPDTLMSVETPIAARGEIHDMTMTDGVMRMRRLSDGIEIPAGGSIELKPGGMHLMFIDLKQAAVEGERVAVKLTFKSGAVAELELPIRKLGASSGDGSEHEDHDHN